MNSTTLASLSNAGQLATTSSISATHTAIQQNPASKNRKAFKEVIAVSSLHQISHNNYEIKTHCSIQQVQKYPKKDRNSAKMLVNLPSSEQRVITFTLPRESCTVQDLLEQVGVPFDDNTTIQCVKSPGAINDYVVTVGSPVQKLNSEIVEDIQMSRQPEIAVALQAPQKGLTEANVAHRCKKVLIPKVDIVAPKAAAAEAEARSSPTPAERFFMPSNITFDEEDDRKLIIGFMAVCPFCGFCGHDHAKCERCKEVFIRKPKRIPNPHVVKAKAAVAKARAEARAAVSGVIATAAAINAAKRRDEKERALSKGVLNRSLTKSLSTNCRPRTLVSSWVRNQSSLNKPAELRIVKLTSDYNEHADKSAHRVPVVKPVPVKEKPVAFEPDATKVNESRVDADAFNQIDVYPPKDIDSELLIRSVESRPAIYDKNHIFYNDRQTKEMLWLEICEILVPQWNQLHVAEKSQIEAQVQNRWQDCKTCFEKEYNAQRDVESGQAITKRIKYEFYDQLLFLLPTINATPESSNTRQDQTDPVEKDGEEPQKAEPLVHLLHPHKQSKSYKERILQVLEGASKENVDEDTHFMLSLVPSLQRCSRAQKLKVKMKFLQAMADVENEAPSSSNSPVPVNPNVPLHLNKKQYPTCSKSPDSMSSIYSTDPMGLRIVEGDASEESPDEEVLYLGCSSSSTNYDIDC